MGVLDHLTCLLRNLYAAQEATELDMEQLTGSKLGKEYKAKYCHPFCLTCTQSASWEISMKVKKQQLELDLEQQTGTK